MRFVILEHDHPVLHWDLMLEAGDMLQTWRLAEAPAPGRAIEATPLGEHRAMYLDYEGPVSGNRGTVKRCDAGTFIEQADSLPDARSFAFDGVRVRGRVRLEKSNDSTWRFTWRGD